MKHKHMLQPVRVQSGFTLFESLVALLVLSVGMLGIAGLLVQGMRYNQDAYVRTQATILAYDMFERMRINGANIAAYPVNNMPAGACNAGGLTLAQADLRCWRDLVAQSLPGGFATINEPQVNQYLITINWVDRNTGAVIPQQWTAMITPD